MHEASKVAVRIRPEVGGRVRAPFIRIGDDQQKAFQVQVLLVGLAQLPLLVFLDPKLSENIWQIGYECIDKDLELRQQAQLKEARELDRLCWESRRLPLQPVPHAHSNRVMPLGRLNVARD